MSLTSLLLEGSKILVRTVTLFCQEKYPQHYYNSFTSRIDLMNWASGKNTLFPIFFSLLNEEGKKVGKGLMSKWKIEVVAFLSSNLFFVSSRLECLKIWLSENFFFPEVVDDAKHLQKYKWRLSVVFLQKLLRNKLHKFLKCYKCGDFWFMLYNPFLGSLVNTSIPKFCSNC